MGKTWPWSSERNAKIVADSEPGKGSSGSTPLLAGEPASEASEKATSGWFGSKGPLVLYTVVLLVSSVGNQVYFKRMTSAMPNYAWYITQLSTVVYVPFFASLSGPAIVSNLRWDFVTKFAVMGFFDGLSGTLMVLGGTETSGTLQVLLSQAVIPFTILFSVIWLRKRFHTLQHMGATVIVLGIVLAKAKGGDDSETNNPVLNLIFFLAVVPCALSSVFKEVAFRGSDEDLDANVLQFWVAVFQCITNFAAMPIYTLDLLGTQRVPLSEMPRLAVGGTKCLFLLEDQVTKDCGFPGVRPCDHCLDAWHPVFMYLGFNVMFNIATILVIKHGSAALSFLVSTLRMPLASLAFASPLIMGSEAVQPGMGDLISLVVIMLGLCTYRYGSQLLQRTLKREAAEGAQAPMPSPNGMWPSPTSNQTFERDNQKWRFAPILSRGFPDFQPTFILVREKGPRPRTAERVRTDLYHRLGAASPLHSPRLRGHSYPTSPSSPGYSDNSGSCSPATPPLRVVCEADALSLPIAAAGEGDAKFDLTGLDEDIGPRRPGVMRNVRKASKDMSNVRSLPSKESAPAVLQSRA